MGDLQLVTQLFVVDISYALLADLVVNWENLCYWSDVGWIRDSFLVKPIFPMHMTDPGKY